MSERFGQGRDLKFGVINHTFNGSAVIATTSEDFQIKVVSYVINSNVAGNQPVSFKSGAVGGALITGDIFLSNTKPPVVSIGQPISHLFETDKGESLYLQSIATVYVGGHFTYFHEYLGVS